MLSSALSHAGQAGLAARARAVSVAPPIPRARCVCRAAGAGDFDPSSSSDTADGPLTDARPLFTLDRASAHDNLTFEDIRDAYEMCSTIPESHERGQCYSVFNIDSDRMAEFYAPVSRLEDALLGGAASGARRELERRAAAASGQPHQQPQQQPQQQQARGSRSPHHPEEEDVNGPLAFLARLFLGH